ncbi:MAG: hypothetical protein QNJ70_12285 [Xenococcaceae cyanobacterium MO_207.B15]|nr:hypothetical protein [Xenococcaceae cyanobacterium MO_207.B15]
MTSVGVTYHKLHHLLTESNWSANQINVPRLEVMIVEWLNHNRDVFIAYKASLGFIRGSIF